MVPRTEVVQAGWVTVVSLLGEHDLASVPKLQAALSATSQEAGARVVVDLSLAPFIDSAVVKWLFRTHRRLADSGGSLVVQIADGHPARRLLELTQLAEIVPLVATRAQALATTCTLNSGQARAHPASRPNGRSPAPHRPRSEAAGKS